MGPACQRAGKHSLTSTGDTATGGSAIKAIEVLISHGVPEQRIIFLNLVSSPEGLEAMYKVYPHVKIVTAWVDEGLNEQKYIVPGLGDFGDRSVSSPTPHCRPHSRERLTSVPVQLLHEQLGAPSIPCVPKSHPSWGVLESSSAANQRHTIPPGRALA